MHKNSKLFAVILVLSLLTCSQKEVFAAEQEHEHNLVAKTDIVSIQQDSCSQDENCVISRILYRRTYICTVSGCDFKEYVYKIQTEHSVEH